MNDDVVEQVNRFNNPQAFLAHAEPFLLGAEAENNLMLGIASTLGSFGEHAYLATVEASGSVVACALRTPPLKAVITAAPVSAIECLVADISNIYPDLAQVHGPDPTVGQFAERWAARTGVPSIEARCHRLFEIREAPTVVPTPEGGIRLATEQDLPTIVAWTTAFVAEALPGDPTDPEMRAANAIATRSLFVWDASGPVSMAGWSGRTARGARITFVYSPPACRGRGFATACVSALTRSLLAEGLAYCCLYTDRSNAISNRLYQKLGYRHIGDASDYVLNSRKPGSVR
jgi:predicted GNAT family acetyltransferase